MPIVVTIMPVAVVAVMVMAVMAIVVVPMIVVAMVVAVVARAIHHDWPGSDVHRGGGANGSGSIDDGGLASPDSDGVGIRLGGLGAKGESSDCDGGRDEDFGGEHDSLLLS